jgi:hypothetical protein
MRSISADEQDDCIERRATDVCRRMLARFPVEAFRIPMPDAARGALVRLAVQTGGAQAIARLIASNGHTVAAHLSVAAGVPADSLVGMWQRRVMAARPASPLPDVAFVLTCLGVIAVCLAWAARGTPWK